MFFINSVPTISQNAVQPAATAAPGKELYSQMMAAPSEEQKAEVSARCFCLIMRRCKDETEYACKPFCPSVKRAAYPVHHITCFRGQTGDLRALARSYSHLCSARVRHNDTCCTQAWKQRQNLVIELLPLLLWFAMLCPALLLLSLCSHDGCRFPHALPASLYSRFRPIIHQFVRLFLEVTHSSDEAQGAQVSAIK